MKKGVASECWQNEYLFEKAAICTSFSAVWCKMECVSVLNGLHFGAKRMVKCRKMRDKKHKHPQQLYK